MDTKELDREVRRLQMMVAKIIKTIGVPAPSRSIEERDRLISEEKCLICEQKLDPKRPSVRGAHEYCARQEREFYTDEELERGHRLLPPSPGGRPRGDVARKAADYGSGRNKVTKRKTKRNDEHGA